MKTACHVRHATPEDAAALRELLSHPSTYGNTLQLPYPSLQQWRNRLGNVPEGHYPMVAELEDGRVVGNITLWRESVPRLAHGASLGITVHPAWQGCGIGTALMRAAIDFADNWLGLHRLELTVFTDNQAAIALYEKMGFAEEALLRAYAFRDGAYRDTLKMARLRSEAQAKK
ncbi:GNAT family N-acetyltransferase [uncultured Aquitalea sp.]|uniref:GNAT family N-acetyltransferase n=1 Tax=uncultured Aquitalea sp. TaxID=540272 RepID=UPI0025D61974|nr:GNAT family N-acetyltransferase [uncultured Aquitalea sp.]